jgi:SWIM zinc finger
VWDQAQVLALAPDSASERSARNLATARSWDAAGANGAAVWGECPGSGAAPYRTAVDLSGHPAYKCSCPSRKIPCKHALALLLLWSHGGVKDGTPPEWAATWLNSRAAKAGARTGGEPADPGAAQRRAEQREDRVRAGLDELDQWLADQVRHGLATTPNQGYAHWDGIAARMVDAQAPGIAERLRALAGIPHTGPGWESRLLEEYALLRLLAAAFRRQAEIGPALAGTVRSRIGFTVRQQDVLADGEHVTDTWQVLARRDLETERIRTRRTWLRGQDTGRFALLLSFAASGEVFDVSLRPGAVTEAELAFYPGAVPLRALAASQLPAKPGGRPHGGSTGDLLAAYARALADDPWLDTWPAVLAGVTAARAPVPCVHDPDGSAVPLHPGARDCWPLLAISAGRPVTLAAEWTPRGLWPLTAWDEAGRAVPL